VFGTASLHVSQLHSMFFSQTDLAPHTLLEKKGGGMRAPKECFTNSRFFVELLNGEVCGAELV